MRPTWSAKVAVALAAVLLLAAWLVSCGSSGSSPGPPPPPPPATITPLTSAEVDEIVKNAAASEAAPLAIAVADRAGTILAVFVNPTAPGNVRGNFSQEASVPDVDAKELAVALARTAAFFSNNQAPLSSRTVRFISGIHFPPGVSFTGPADLYGIENTNRGCSFNATYNVGKQINPSRSINGTSNGLGIITGKSFFDDSDPNAVNPGGVPLFRRDSSGKLLGVIGGIGVVSSTADIAAGGPIAEFAAVAGAASGATPPKYLPTFQELPPPGIVVVGGISLPFVTQITPPAGVGPGSTAGTYVVGPSNGTLPPEGYLVGPNAGTGGLTQNDVDQIIQASVAEANKTRAVIRLPNGQRTKMTIAVSDLDGKLLGLYRMTDGTVFSIDVAVAKSRNVIWFSGAGISDLAGLPANTAVTNRTISFGAQPLFPPGIDGSGPGPFYNVYLHDVQNPCTQGLQPTANANFASGIVFFPGSLPLYKNGTLVGGLGVSGDGVDQDDWVTFQGAQGFLPPAAAQADNFSIQGVRMPYLKFPRNPEQ